MGKLIVLLVSLNILLASQVFSLPMALEWQHADGTAAVLNSYGDNGNRDNEVIRRDNSPISIIRNAFYWNVAGLLLTNNISDALSDNGHDEKGRSIQIYWIGGTKLLQGDNLWNKPLGTIFQASVESYLAGANHSDLLNDKWIWKATAAPSQVKRKLQADPFRHELADHVYFDYYGYNDAVGYNIFSGSVSNKLMSIFPVPEPSTILLFGAGFVGLATFRRKRS